MDWQLLGKTFALVFLAELGDKTQLATLTLAASNSSRLAVFVGSALALMLASALGVLGGGLVARFASPIWLQRGAGVLFVVLGVAYLWGTRGARG